MMRPFALLITGVIFIFGKSFAQPGNDSAAVSEGRAAFKISVQNADSGSDIAERLILQSQRTQDDRLAAYAYKARGWAFFHKGLMDKSISDLLLCSRLFRKLHDSQEELRSYVNISLVYSNSSQFGNSAKYLILADSLAQQVNDLRDRGEVKRQMAILYREQGQYPKAVASFRESMDLHKANHDTLSYVGAATSLCIAYKDMSMPDSSLAILKECAPLIYAMPGRTYEKGVLNERLGDAYFIKSMFEKAFDSYDRAFKMFSAARHDADMAYEAMNLGKTLTRLKKYKDAEAYLLLSYRLDDSLKIDNYLPDAAEQLAGFYQATGDWKKCSQWLTKEVSLKDSLQGKAQNEKAEQLQAQYEADKKEKEIALLRKDQELNHAVVQKQKVVQRAVILSVSLLLLAGVFAVSRYRVAQKSRRQAEIEKIRNSIASDLHDDMGSALSSINIISKVALDNPNDRENVNRHLKKIHENSTVIMENMSDIVWAINPANDTLEKIILKMREFAADLFEPLNIIYDFEEQGDFRQVKLGLQQRKDVYLIFKEAVNNAAKYSGAAAITILIAEKNGGIEMEIDDNGKGFSKEDIKCGNGLKNMEERARKMQAELVVNSAPGGGTSVRLTLRSHE